jgi:hypothetical protein
MALIAQSAADTGVKISFGGFVDGYYAYDLRRPINIDRAFTTQAARANEFNVNLAFIDAALAAPRVRGRLALQFGTAVQANYAPEPRVGTFSGPDVSRFIQEATAGYQVAPTLWIDGGVFFAPFGSENWISRDNWTYTRSLIADNSPYYEAGVKATWQASKQLVAQLHVINGWQNISETNSDKALGARLDYSPSSRVTFSYDAFAGNEAPDTAPSRLRVFQEGVVQAALTQRLGLRLTYDYGIQRHAPASGTATWSGYAIVARLQTSDRVSVAARFEGYSDPEQVIVATGQSYGLRATGGSLNLDISPHAKLLWRTEARLLRATDPLFPDRTSAGQLASRDPVLLTSLALTF